MASSNDDAAHVRRLYRTIYAIVRRIPRGRVATYGQIAELAGIPGGSRIAGAALKVAGNERGLPWQRVVGKAAPRRARIQIHDPVGAAVQRQKLEAEGVPIGDTGLIALDRYGWLPSTTNGQPEARAGSSRGASPRRQPRSASTRRASSSRR